MNRKYYRALESLLIHNFIVVDEKPTVMTSISLTFQINENGHVIKLDQ